MIGARGRPPRLHQRVTALDRVADLERPLLYYAHMREDFTELLLRLCHIEMDALRPHDDANIAGLPAGFAVERRLVDDDDAFLALLEQLDGLAALEAARPPRLRRLGVVA